MLLVGLRQREDRADQVQDSTYRRCQLEPSRILCRVLPGENTGFRPRKCPVEVRLTTQNRRPQNRSDRFTLVVLAIPPSAGLFWIPYVTPRQWREVRPESLDLLETSLELLEN